VTLLLLSYLAGALTILAPCILPVVPFVFARADRPFLRSGLPLLAGLALGFVAVATLTTVAGAWAANANEAARALALLALAVAGLALLMPALANLLSRPLLALAGRLGAHAERKVQLDSRSVLPSLVLGFATGLLWAPCTGPILGLVLSTAALQGPGARSTLLLSAYAAGAATSLALALWGGGRVFAALKRTLGAGEWIRRALGVAVLAGVTMIALGLDKPLLAILPAGATDALEQGLLERWHRKPAADAAVAMPVPRLLNAALPIGAQSLLAASQAADLPVEGRLPELTGATAWLNSEPLTAAGLRGKVVLIDIWTFDCINCRNALPYVHA